LLAIFNELKDVGGKVNLIDLRSSLLEVNVQLRAELLWDLLHVADVDGVVRLDYDEFARLLIGVLDSSDFRWGGGREGNEVTNGALAGSVASGTPGRQITLDGSTNTENYMQLLNDKSVNITPPQQTNWDLMMQHHAGEWKGVWTCYSGA
jgi:hypothetical protein